MVSVEAGLAQELRSEGKLGLGSSSSQESGEDSLQGELEVRAEGGEYGLLYLQTTSLLTSLLSVCC